MRAAGAAYFGLSCSISMQNQSISESVQYSTVLCCAVLCNAVGIKTRKSLNPRQS